MANKFLVGVADVRAMVGNNVIFTAKTLDSSGISVSVTENEIRGGKGNTLQNLYYHSGQLEVNMSDVQWKLEYIALNTGSTIVNGGKVWNNETVTLASSVGTLTGVPVTLEGQTALSVWTEYNGVYYTLPVTQSGSTYTFTIIGTAAAGVIPANATLCVAYMNSQNSARTITIPSNIIPSKVTLFMDADIYGDQAGGSKIGTISIEIPTFQLSGNQDLSMTADGYATSNLSGKALAYTSSTAGCSNASYYAKITEYITGEDTYASVTGLAIEGGDFELVSQGTTTLRVWAVKGDNTSFLCDNADLTFSSDKTSVATVGQHTGLVTAGTYSSSANTANISVSITSKSTIEATAKVTVTNA